MRGGIRKNNRTQKTTSGPLVKEVVFGEWEGVYIGVEKTACGTLPRGSDIKRHQWAHVGAGVKIKEKILPGAIGPGERPEKVHWIGDACGGK